MRPARHRAWKAAALLVALLWVAAPGAQPPDGSRPPDAPLPATVEPEQRPPGEQQRLDDLVERADDGFVPISELPPEEQLPAAPMLVAAYVVVVLGIFLYLLSLSRRLAGVKQEIARLELESKRTGRT